MSSVSNIESLRAWLRTCPEINSKKHFSVDYIGDDETCYAIYAAPSTIDHKRDILGGVWINPIQTLTFYFGATMPFSGNTRQNMENHYALEQLIAWMYEKNAQLDFPTIQEGTVLSILPTLTAYPHAIGANYTVYRITIQMTYRRK